MWHYLIRWRKLLIVTGLTAGIASAIFSGPAFIKPLYKSTVVLYPATTNSISKALLSENAYDRSDPLAFGEEEEAEQLLQLLNSDLIRNRIVEKYQLMTHYEIAPDDPFRQTKRQLLELLRPAGKGGAGVGQAATVQRKGSGQIQQGGDFLVAGNRAAKNALDLLG